MTTLPEHARRWEHKTHARPTSHWSTDPTDTSPHPGDVARCEKCGARTCGPCRRGQHGCCDRGPYVACDCCPRVGAA